ncbi:ABC transporter substrate-binding protein [Brachybacterium paraconglomeratum]|uniref:ABC transporter substrate-binding protein n=1 Tax=Brachybacterium paraconglomeratum TaxID=173362 RepID=UPI003512BC1B
MTAFTRRSLGTLALTATAATAALTACGGGSGSGSSDGSTELSLWMPTQEDAQGEAISALIDAFEKANPGITVTLEQRSVDDHKTAMRQAAGTDLVPDIYWYWEGSGLGGELIDVGMSKDLSDVYAEKGWEERFTPASLAGITQYGGFHGVPWTLQGEGLYYSKELFEQAGVTEEPTTYEELVGAAEKLLAAGITPIEFGGTVNWHVMRLLDSLLETTCGAELADSLNTGDGDWSAEPAVTEAFTELKTWGDTYFNEGYMGISNDDSSQLFFSGQAAMALEGTWFNASVVANGMDPATLGVFPFPTGTDRLYGFGEAFYVSETTEKIDAAVAFLDFLTSAEGQEIAGTAWGAISVNKDVPVDESNPLNTRWAEIFEASDAGMYTNNDQNFSTAATTEFWRIQNSVLTGEIAPGDAGAEFQAFRAQNG